MARHSTFSWDNFEQPFLEALAAELGYTEHARDGQTPQQWLSTHVKRIDEHFIRKSKQILERAWLPQYRAVNLIVDKLIDARIGPMSRPTTPAEYVAYIRKCRNTKTVRNLLLKYLLLDGENSEPDGARIPPFCMLRPNEQPADTREPFSYQREAWDALQRHYADAQTTGVFAGLLEMPTGSGKTYTTVQWLLRTVVNAGGRILWIAHRYELLEQAASEFYRQAAHAEHCTALRIRVVSGHHCSLSEVSPTDDIIICSIGSIARRMDIIEDLLHDPNCFVVIDEAHHTVARTYHRLVRALPPARRLLGITATPTRTAEDERPVLASLFGGNTLYQVAIRPLIEQGFLARPMPVQVMTHQRADAGVTATDQQFLAQFNELSDVWLERIANLEGRNQVIVEEYLSNRAKYGKTLVFAINVRHAALLTESFRAAGVSAAYIASYRPDGSEGSTGEILNEFRQTDSGLDVLINVQILTEGVDLPMIQSVFLARPTASDILLRQMVGRALRGPRAHGTTHAYLVSFEDHWGQFTEFECPFARLSDIFGPVTLEDEKSPVDAKERTLFDALPWDLIQATAAELRRNIDTTVDAFEAVPHGWYLLDRNEGDDNSVQQIIPVYAHQYSCWEALITYLSRCTPAQRAAFTRETQNLEALYQEYFADCDIPQPARHYVSEIIYQYQDQARPEYHHYLERTESDPQAIAELIVTQNLRMSEVDSLLDERHHARLAQAIYPSLREFRTAVDDALFEISHPDERTRSKNFIVIFEPRPDQQLTPGPAHDLQILLTEVLTVGAGLLNIPQLPGNEITLEWTTRLIKGWSGKAYYETDTPHGSGRIRINCLLNSPDVTSDTLRFLLWHEYLHLYLKLPHPKVFRDLERQWPGYVDASRELDTLNERFGITYW